jgi:hypothetical protein
MKSIITLLLTLWLSGCVAVRYDLDRLTDPQRVGTDAEVAEHFQRVEELSTMIAALGPLVDHAEARQVAEVALSYPMQLAEDYGLTTPPITHNMLVNMGMRPRGLCTHWAEDMLRRLDELDLKTLRLYWAVAYPTKPFRLEHSSALVAAREKDFNSGIVLDAWRDSGKLFYSKVLEDERYNWQRLHNYITDPPPETSAAN